MHIQKQWSVSTHNGGDPKFVLRLVGTIFAIVGSIFFGVAWYLDKETKEIAQWPRQEVMIEASEVVRFRDSEQDIMYRPNITFHYTVDGQKVLRDTVSRFQSSFSDPSWAQNIVNQYQPGSTVLAYANPDDPTEAYLDPTISRFFLYIFFGLGGLFAISGVLLVIFAGRIPIKTQAPSD